MSQELFFKNQAWHPFAPQGIHIDQPVPQQLQHLLISDDDLALVNGAPLKSSTLRYMQEKYEADSTAFFTKDRLSLAFFDWETVREVLSKKESDFIKGRNETALGSTLGWGLFTEEGQKHRKERATLNPAFHRLAQEKYSSAIQAVLESRGGELQNPDGFEITPFVRKAMYEISMLGFLGLDKGPFDFDFEYHLGEVQKFVTYNSYLRNQIWRESVRDYVSARSLVVGHVTEVASAIVKSAEDSENIFQKSLVELYGNRIEPGYGLAGQVGQFLTAGTETTSSLVANLIAHLAIDPGSWESLALDLVSGNSETLKAVINEMLRLRPPATLLSRVAVRDTEIRGVLVPAGTEVFVSAAVTQNMSKYYQNPEVFNPERWETQSSDKPFFPFGYGPRMCIGFQTATATVLAVMEFILTNFRPIAVSGDPWEVEEYLIQYPPRTKTVQLVAA